MTKYGYTNSKPKYETFHETALQRTYRIAKEKCIACKDHYKIRILKKDIAKLERIIKK